ncbi:MAG TPA: hypothetical protein VMW16_16915 [Sedimentisphaerales bacterium]|nr:hypothetical protein [Sedimentisphaerales bacterium]
MTYRPRLLGTALFICTFALAGCTLPGADDKAKAPRTDPLRRIPAEQQKARLLRKLDRKFEDADTHFQLGQLYQADGLWKEAEYHYTTALSFDPVHWPAQAALVKVLQASGEPAKARLSAEIYMNQASASAKKALELGLAFQNQDLGDYALACYQQALHLAPNSPQIHRQIGYYYLSRNDKAHAKEYLVRSFQLNPYQPDVAGELGRMGVAIKIPRKTQKDTKKLDKIVERSENKTKS